MLTNPPTISDFSPLFQEQHDQFQTARDTYLDIQETYQATIKETARLEQAAQALDAQAVEATASWKAMAKARHADQRKINQEAERIAGLKMEAEKFRLTAEVRVELHGELVVQIAKARGEVSNKCTAVRGLYRDERVSTLLATEGLPELLRELRDLAGSDDFARLVNQAASSVEPSAAPILDGVSVPKTIPGELVTRNGMELRRLELSGGTSTTNHAMK